MKNKQLISFLFILLTCITLSACGSKQPEEAQNIEVQVDVKVAHPLPASDSLFIEAQGKIISNDAYAIPALSDGKILKTYVNANDPVKKGQIIAYISNPESNSDIAVLQQKLSVNQGAINNLESRLSSAREMVKIGVIAKNDITTVQNDIYTRKAERQDILATLQKLQIRRNNYKVASNYSGYITSVLPEGSFVTYGQTIASIIALGDEYVETFVPVDQINAVRTGQEAVITSNDLSVKGRILNIFPNATSNLIKVVVRPENVLLANLDVKVKLKRKGINGFVIPKAAVVLNEGKPVVFIVKGDKAYQRSIIIQKDYVDKVIVSQGLNASDNVVTDNAYLLSDGTKVTVK